MQDAITRLKNVKDSQEFSLLLPSLRTFLKTLDTTPQCLMELEQRAYYPVNEYSDKGNVIIFYCYDIPCKLQIYLLSVLRPLQCQIHMLDCPCFAGFL